MGNVLVKAAVTDMSIQWLLFLVAAYFKTEMFYDLAGSSTFILLIMQSITKTGRFYPRQVRDAFVVQNKYIPQLTIMTSHVHLHV